MKNLILLLSVLTFTGAAHAKNQRECTAVDLRSPALGEVRDQANAGWCFAYTTADLVTHRMNQKISATDLAINFYYQMPEMPKTDKLSQAAGGSDMGAMSYINNRYCAEDVMPSNDYVLPKQCQPTNKKFEALDVVRLVENSNNSLSECQMAMVKALFKNLNSEDIQKIMSNSKLSPFMKINEMRVKNCGSSRIKSNLAMKSGLRSGFDSLKDVDDQLNKGNIVSLNYDAWFLVRTKKGNDVDNHYSSIVGRRTNEKTNTCQYLIRNSWGKNCSIYPAPYNSQCEEGNIWVDENVLGQSIIGIHFLK